MNYKVLYVEDENYLARIVAETMEIKGYKIMHLKDGLRILENISSFAPDICVLDVMLPHIDGFSLGSTIRSVYPSLPIIFLTAKSQTQDVLKGFSSGGTDYLKKPFSMEELMIRIDNQLKLRQQQHKEQRLSSAAIVNIGTFTYSPMRLELKTEQHTIKLSNREATLMNVFCAHINSSIDRAVLMLQVWGDDSYFTSRNLDVYIRRLRAYFAQGKGVEIITLKGKGYHFSVSA